MVKSQNQKVERGERLPWHREEHGDRNQRKRQCHERTFEREPNPKVRKYIRKQKEQPRKSEGDPGAIRQQRVRKDERNRDHHLDAWVEAVEKTFRVVITIKSVEVHL